MQFSDLEKSVKQGKVYTYDLTFLENNDCYWGGCPVKKTRIVSLWACLNRREIRFIRSLHQHCATANIKKNDELIRLNEKEIFTLRILLENGPTNTSI